MLSHEQIKLSRLKRLVMFASLLAAFLFLSSIDTRDEAERVESQTADAGRNLQALDRAKTAPLLGLKIILHDTFGSQDARNHFMEEFDLGVVRLLELGVLVKREFPITDANARMQIIRRFNGASRGPIWRIRSLPEGVEVIAKPVELAKWESLIGAYATTNSILMNSVSGSGGVPAID